MKNNPDHQNHLGTLDYGNRAGNHLDDAAGDPNCWQVMLVMISWQWLKYLMRDVGRRVLGDHSQIAA